MVLLLEEEDEAAPGLGGRMRRLARSLLRRIESGPAGVPARLALARTKSWVRSILSLRARGQGVFARRTPRRVADDLFDAAYYTATYEDVAQSGLDPLEHYHRIGAREGRAPNAIVHVAAYRFDHPDLARFGGDVLLHYVRVGRLRGATPHPLFDPAWYRAAHPDIGARDPYEHYLHVGRSEGRAGCAVAMGDDSEVAGIVLSTVDASKVRTTIIIPAFGQAALTLRCLHALSRHTSEANRMRVILADDDPTRPLAALLDDVKGLEVVANEHTLGFLRSCNATARLASGEYIVLLNNDTVVQADWLDALVSVADRDASVAIVGAKLIRSDGRLQEAGVTMFRDGWGDPYGRGDDPGLSRYSFVREVDAVSGACLLIRRSAWQAVEGFDDSYAPAFFEEYDLAFALADRGWKVMYQPAARVVHTSNASYGPEARDRQSIVNHHRFVERWDGELASRYEGPRDLYLARERPHERGVVLIIDDKVPEYDKHAGALGTFQYLGLMIDEGFKVMFLADDGIAREPYTGKLQQLGVEVITGRINMDSLFKEIGRHLDWAIISRPWVAPRYLHHLRERSHARVLYHPQDLYSLRERRRYEVTGDREALRESRRLYQIERQIYRRVDCGLTLSEDEVPIIQAMAPGTEIRVMTPYFYEAADFGSSAGPPLPERRSIVFVGAYDHLPNVDAATVLVREVMPHVWARVPDAQVLLVGDFAPGQIEELASDHVAVLGYVADLQDIWDRARISVSPIRFGAGVKGKVVHSLQAGVPVVTTTIGNEGIRLQPGVEVLIGETSEEIAAHVISLFEDPQKLLALASAGTAFIRERYSRERARADLFAAFGIDEVAVSEK